MTDRQSRQEDPEEAAMMAAYWKRMWSRHSARRNQSNSVNLEAIGSTIGDDEDLPTIE